MRPRLLAGVGSLAALALLAVPVVPAVAADEVEATVPGAEGAVEPTEPTELTEPGEPSAPVEGLEDTEPSAPTAPGESTEPTGSVQPAEPVAPVPAGPSCVGGGLGDGPVGGASNPVDGTRWVAEQVAPGRLVLRRALDGGTTAPLATLELPGAPGAAGGLTFGADGRLYVVAAADAGGEAVLFRTALPLRPSTRPLEVAEVSRASTDAPVTRIAFTRDGLLHLVSDGFSTAIDPVTGETVATYGAAAGQALACGRPSQLTVRVALPRGRVAPTDQLAVTLTGAAYDGSPVAPRGVTAGDDTGRQAKLGEYVQVLALPGATYDVVLTTADGLAPTAYDVALACDDGPTRLVDTPGTSGTVTMPDRSSSPTCTFTAVPAEAEPTEPTEPDGDRGAGPRASGPAVLTLGRDDGLLGGGVGTDREKGREKTEEPDDSGDGARRDASGAGLGRDLGDQMRQDGALGGGLGDLGGGMPGATGTGTDTETGADRTSGARDPGPNLPNTGGPPAVVLPVALGAIALGSVLVARRRRPTGHHRARA
ncbi:hypothetical protein [Nocardioides sp. CFH 31398]|uniref:hypothetical protein n=1 Tax=Nocardioides sp. CFH 31398 TaxID=2919579 RepID=UPI001F06FEF0|nr:hypothetical protein [Nocardioides sp. CFH 31398]MCH1865074.1 hypothetical protein [Nocardioides sp. CFH 31398]